MTRRRFLTLPSCRQGPANNIMSELLASFVALLLLLASHASAARIPFDNCLSDAYIYTNPDLTPDQVQLQFVPLVADAVFDAQDPSHNLKITIWGNVTGRVGDATLPPAGSPEWENSTASLPGKIQNTIEQGMPQFNATTLHSVVDVLTYTPFTNDSYFCLSLTNGSCPLGPVFNNTPYDLSNDPYGLPSFGLSNDFDSTYALASFAPTLIIRYGDQEATDIGCISATVTPSLGNTAWTLKYLPLAVLVLAGLATVFAAIYSPWGTTDIFHWTSNYGRDPDLLRLVTPGFGDCLNYIQFIVLTGSLSLSYPGYYQPVVSQASWSILLFDVQFVSKMNSFKSIVDGVYITPGYYGLERIAQLNGLGQDEDIWAGMIVWLLVIIVAVFVLTQLGFLARWLWRTITGDSEEDFRAKNIPFSLGNVIRIVFNYFLLPIVSLSAFQLVVASSSASYLVGLAAVTLVLLIGFSVWLIRLILITKPRAHLFDDLPSVLLYGPLYNTYCDETAGFALIPITLNLIRGVVIGAVQPSGIAQVVILGTCEVVYILTLHAFRPFHSPTSMNAYHLVFSLLRFITIIFMVTFIPSLGLTEGTKGWLGYAILVIHASVLLFGFLLNAVQTFIEVIARLCGAADDDIRGQTRGGLSKIFGARQLSRRVDRRGAPSRQSQLSSVAMLDAAENASRRGYGRVRSESAASMGILMNHQRNSSAMDARSVDAYSIPLGSSTIAATTPREASTFDFLPSPAPGQATRPQPAADPYYRPPRARRGTIDEMGGPSRRQTQDSFGSIDLTSHRLSQGMGDVEGDHHASGKAGPVGPAPYAPVFAPRADYSTREVDFYYGVRGPALNSESYGRKLGTGPADPTSPVVTATGWLKRLFGGKTKEKGKGFEVVRSARMPPAMQARGEDMSDDGPPEGIPVALGNLRNGPIESDDEDDTPRSKKVKKANHARGENTGEPLVNVASDPESDVESDNGFPTISKDPPLLPDVDAGSTFNVPSRVHSKASRHPSQRTAKEALDLSDMPEVPEVPRKSSKRNSSTDKLLSLVAPNSRSSSQPRPDTGVDESQRNLTATARLPFDRSDSQRRPSGSSNAPTEDLNQLTGTELSENINDRPASIGYVHQRNISRVDPDQNVDLLGSTAEIISSSSRKPSPNSSVSGRS
ncbi:integral membrane protein [Xylariaceae sp. FL0255]|nr:integral membrane protein [Xylariaceae sp. FL0255]